MVMVKLDSARAEEEKLGISGESLCKNFFFIHRNIGLEGISGDQQGQITVLRLYQGYLGCA